MANISLKKVNEEKMKKIRETMWRRCARQQNRPISRGSSNITRNRKEKEEQETAGQEH
jgi:hypothetical protein